MMEAFLDAYTAIRPFDTRDLEHMDDFVIARYLNILGWITTRADVPDLRARIPRTIRRVREACRTWRRRR